MLFKNSWVFVLALFILPSLASASFVEKSDQLITLIAAQEELNKNPVYNLRFFINVPGGKTDVISSYTTKQAFGLNGRVFSWYGSDNSGYYFRLPTQMQDAVLCTHVLGDIELPEKAKALLAWRAYGDGAFKGYLENSTSTRRGMQLTMSRNLRIASDSSPRCGLASMKKLMHAVWSPQNLSEQEINDFCRKINSVPGRFAGENCFYFNDYSASMEVNKAPYRFNLSELITGHIDHFSNYNCRGAYCGLNLFFSKDYEAMSKQGSSPTEKYSFVRLLTPQRYSTKDLSEAFCIADPRIGELPERNIKNYLVEGSAKKDLSWKLYMAYYNLFRSQYLPRELTGIQVLHPSVIASGFSATDINLCGAIIGQPAAVRLLVDSLEKSARKANFTDVIIPTVADFDMNAWALRSNWGGKGNYGERLINRLLPNSSKELASLKQLGIKTLPQFRQLAKQLDASDYNNKISAQVLLDFKQDQNLAISKGLASATEARKWTEDEAEKVQERQRLAAKAALEKRKEKKKQRLAKLEEERQSQAKEIAKQETERKRIADISRRKKQQEVAHISEAGGYKILGMSLADPISAVPKTCRIKAATFKDIMGVEFSLLTCSYKDRGDQMQIVFKGKFKPESILRIHRVSLYQPFTKPNASNILNNALKHYGSLYSKMGYFNADKYSYNEVPGQELAIIYHLCSAQNQMLDCAGKAFDAIEYELRSSDMTAYIKEVKNAALNVNEERF